MKISFAAAFAICLLLTGDASAHRLDEYLQATIFSIEKDRVQASMRLIPGVAVTPLVLAELDSDGDGIISEPEQRAYAQRVLNDISLTSDGVPLRPQLQRVQFPKIEEMREGLGEIHIEFTANLPRRGGRRTLIFENHHESRISVYLVNCLVPGDPGIQITSQNRNQLQSFYELDYQAGGTSASWSAGPQYWWRGFMGMFGLGMRHIAEGTDHLLFLLTLLLPAPLICRASRWSGSTGVRRSLLQILRVVTAFTVGHSITLALAAFETVRVAGRPIEVLIAVSILVSALHALRPLFPGREALIAAFFGLIHGLAFASTLSELGIGGWERVVSVFGFNIGIETMQLMVVAAVMPSLLLLGRTAGYGFFRIAGALLAGTAAAGWMVERLFDLHSSVDTMVNYVARSSIWVAAALFLVSVACWSLSREVGGGSLREERA